MPDPIKTKIELVPKIMNGQDKFLYPRISISHIKAAKKKDASPPVYKT